MEFGVRNLVVALTTAFMLVACGKKEVPAPPPPAPVPVPVPAPAPPPAPVGVTVTAVALGKAIGSDKRVTAAADTFAKGDTIHASIDTTGTGTATLEARWTFTKDGKTVPVKTDTAAITPTGPATTEFHISKPDGWPIGSYQVEILVGGKSVSTKTFQVK